MRLVFRRKIDGLLVDAFQMTADHNSSDYPKWLHGAMFRAPELLGSVYTDDEGVTMIHTLAGHEKVQPGDWIAQDRLGRLSLHKPDDFSSEWVLEEVPEQREPVPARKISPARNIPNLASPKVARDLSHSWRLGDYARVKVDPAPEQRVGRVSEVDFTRGGVLLVPLGSAPEHPGFGWGFEEVEFLGESYSETAP